MRRCASVTFVATEVPKKVLKPQDSNVNRADMSHMRIRWGLQGVCILRKKVTGVKRGWSDQQLHIFLVLL